MESGISIEDSRWILKELKEEGYAESKNSESKDSKTPE
jgi:hypothetical protein